MRRVEFTTQETACLARLCQWLALGGPQPLAAHHFRAFLVARLRARNAGLGAKVAAADDGQLADLYATLRDRQALAHSLVFA